MKKIIAILLFNCLSQTAFADWNSSIKQAWDQSKDMGDLTIDRTKDLYYEYSGDVRVLTTAEQQLITPEQLQQEKKEHLQHIWPEVLNQLDEALMINTEIDDAPESAWMGNDKTSLLADQVEIFSLIEVLFENPELRKNRKNINKLHKKVDAERQKIAKLREDRILSIGDIKTGLNKKIKQAQSNIVLYEANIAYQKKNLLRRLQQMGLDLDNQQIDILLARVDSDDMIRMSILYSVLADITKQLMELTQEFNENISHARKYYGMQVVLMKMLVTMQKNYVHQLKTHYLPKIEVIQQHTQKISDESKALLKTEKQVEQRRVLENNLKAQQLTLYVAKLYSQQLNKQLNKVTKAMQKAKNDYRVAKNTFETVKLSAELIHLMRSNQTTFNALMTLQTPEILPFENIQMQRKFEDLSVLLRQ